MSFNVVTGPEVMKQLGLDSPELVAAIDRATWDNPEDLRALATAILSAGRSGEVGEQWARLSFLGGVASAALEKVARRLGDIPYRMQQEARGEWSVYRGAAYIKGPFTYREDAEQWIADRNRE